MTRASKTLPVVLVAGRVGGVLLLARLRTALDGAGLTVVAVDPGLEVSGARAAMQLHGSHAVQLVGHGEGGLVARRLAAGGPLTGLVATVVTVASPHRTSEAGSARPALTSARWVSFYSDRDPVAPPVLARLTPDLTGSTDVANHLITGCGHLGLCHDERLVRAVVAELARPDVPPGAGAVALAQTFAQTFAQTLPQTFAQTFAQAVPTFAQAS